MSKKLYTLCIAIIGLLLPSYAFAQASIADNIDSSYLEPSISDIFSSPDFGLNRGIAPSEVNDGGGRYVNTNRGNYNASNSSGGSVSGKYVNTSSSNNSRATSGRYVNSNRGSSHRTTTRVRSRRVYHHNNYNYRPQPRMQVQVAPTVVHHQSSVIEPTNTYAVPLNVASTFAMGIRAVGFYPGKMTSMDGGTLRYKTSGGVGFYTRYRPVRWVGLEFLVDFTYGKDEDCTNYLRLPSSIGIQFHVFDYGMLNVYAIAAASITAVYTSSENIKDRYYQYGGQFGAGTSVILGGLELGLDVRYTLDTPPSAFNTTYGTFYPKDELRHGVVFAANIGLAF